jgi:Fe-Mn family superoxide dismutase
MQMIGVEAGAISQHQNFLRCTLMPKTELEKKIKINKLISAENKMIKLKDIFEDANQIITEFNRPALKYKMNALNKHIDTKTMEEHYGVHFKKYTDNLNETIKDEKIRVGSIHELLRLSVNYSKKLRNNAGGYFNHILYFDQFTPEKKSPEGKLKYLLEREFGDFTSEFTQAGLDLFGSGWVWLVSDGTDNLSIITTPNQDNPYMASNFGGQILLISKNFRLLMKLGFQKHHLYFLYVIMVNFGLVWVMGV